MGHAGRRDWGARLSLNSQDSFRGWSVRFPRRGLRQSICCAGIGQETAIRGARQIESPEWSCSFGEERGLMRIMASRCFKNARYGFSAVEAWRAESGPHVRQWMMHRRFRALSALAGYAYEHPLIPSASPPAVTPCDEERDWASPLLPIHVVCALLEPGAANSAYCGQRLQLSARARSA